MPRVHLIHWKEAELSERVERLAKAGYAATAWAGFESMAAIRSLADAAAAAIVIDLGRLPSHGREVGVALRTAKATRHLPLVFVDGTPEKVARVKQVLPDATYASWRGIRGALKRAIAKPPVAPVNPGSNLAAYAKAPLAKKLGIRPGASVALLGAPHDFGKTLAPLPPDVTLRRDARARTDLTLLFVVRRRDLEARLERMVPRSELGGLWICWPKKTSGVASDLTQPDVRRLGLAAGMVDFKICAIDETWSGLRFTARPAQAVPR